MSEGKKAAESTEDFEGGGGNKSEVNYTHCLPSLWSKGVQMDEHEEMWEKVWERIQEHSRDPFYRTRMLVLGFLYQRFDDKNYPTGVANANEIGNFVYGTGKRTDEDIKKLMRLLAAGKMVEVESPSGDLHWRITPGGITYFENQYQHILNSEEEDARWKFQQQQWEDQRKLAQTQMDAQLQAAKKQAHEQRRRHWGTIIVSLFVGLAAPYIAYMAQKSAQPESRTVNHSGAQELPERDLDAASKSEIFKSEKQQEVSERAQEADQDSSRVDSIGKSP